jgi:ABC-type dipeptide/oligopeptide/nickel transport system permease component
MGMVLEHFWPATAQLALAALVLAVVLPIPLGVIAATHRNGALDHASRLGSLFLQSMPSFWLGLMLILLFAVALGGLLRLNGATVPIPAVVAIIQERTGCSRATAYRGVADAMAVGAIGPRET